MIVAGNLGHIPVYLYPQLCASCSPPHYCGFLTVNRALHLPPQLKKKHKTVLQQQLFVTLEPKYYAF